MLSFPLSTTGVCELVGVPEHRARNLIRWGKLSVPCIGGRRLWFQPHVMALARLTGLDTPALRNVINATPTRTSDHNYVLIPSHLLPKEVAHE